MKMMKKKLSLTVALALSAMTYSSCLAAEAEKINEYVAEDIVVTAERIPTEKLNTPANVTVVTAEEIEDNRYQTVTEALENVPGVSMVRTDTTNYVQLNGTDRVVVLVDGRRINNEQGGTSGRASVNTAMLPSTKIIDRIEIVKGGGSALYGSDAVGGVINIITKKGEKSTTSIDLMGGSGRTAKGEITHTGSFNKLSWNLDASLEHRGYYKYKYHGKSQKMTNSDLDADNVSIRLNQKFTDRESLDFVFDHRSQTYGSYDCSGNTSYASGHASEVHNNAGLTFNFKEGSDAPGFLRYFNNYKTADNYGKFNTRTQGVDYQNGWKLGDKNTLIAGAEWHRSRSSNVTGGGYEAQAITNTAIYLQDTMQLSDKWTFVPGVRMDHHTSFGTHWTPKAALNYRAAEKTQFYANWGRVFKAPTADDMYYNLDWGGSYKYIGNKNLQAETGWTASIGVNHSFSKAVSTNLNFFKTDLTDAIVWSYVGGGNYKANNQDERQQGMEISLKHRLGSKWNYDLAYTYTDTKVGKGTATKWNERNASPNGYRLGVHYAAGKWKANLNGNINSGLNTAKYIAGHYAIWNASASYDVNKQLTAYLKLNNIFNAEYSYYPSTYTIYPGQGRSFQVGINYTF